LLVSFAFSAQYFTLRMAMIAELCIDAALFGQPNFRQAIADFLQLTTDCHDKMALALES